MNKIILTSAVFIAVYFSIGETFAETHYFQNSQTGQMLSCSRVTKDNMPAGECVDAGNGAYGYGYSMGSGNGYYPYSYGYGNQYSNSSNMTKDPLVQVINKNDVSGAKKILSKKDFDINKNEGLYLAFAATIGKPEMVKLLLDHGANPNLNFGTALFSAKDATSAKYILSTKGFDLDNVDGAFTEALASGRTDVAKVLFDAKKPPASSLCSVGYDDLGNFYFKSKAHDPQFLDSNLGQTLTPYMEQAKFEHTCAALTVAPSKRANENDNEISIPFGSGTNH